MNQDTEHHCHAGNQQAVSKRVPEIGYFHGFLKIRQAPGGWKRQRARNIVRHLRRLFKRDNDRHIQWKKYCQSSQNQKHPYHTVNGLAPDHATALFYFFILIRHHNCSSLPPKNLICRNEITTIMTKNTNAFALWNPNCPPLMPLL